MPKPRSFRYPQALIKQGEKTLGEKLQKLIRQVLRGDLSKVDGREQGHIILEEHYKEQVTLINEFTKNKGLVGITGLEKDPQEALEDAKEGWNKIIDDIP